MSVHKQSVSFTDPAFAFARTLVESGEYPTISAAVSGELVRARRAREREQAMFEAEVLRRISLPPDQWEEIGPAGITDTARAHLLRRSSGGT